MSIARRDVGGSAMPAAAHTAARSAGRGAPAGVTGWPAPAQAASPRMRVNSRQLSAARAIASGSSSTVAESKVYVTTTSLKAVS